MYYQAHIDTQIRVYFFLSCLEFIWSHVESRGLDLLANKKKMVAELALWYKYSDLSLNSRESDNVMTFMRKIERYINVIAMELTWGLPTVVSLFINTGGFIFALVSKGNGKMIFLFVGVISVWYFFVVRRYMKKYTAKRKESRDLNEALHNMARLEANRLHAGDATAVDVTKHTSASMNNFMEQHFMWKNIQIMQSIPIYFIMGVIAFWANQADIPVLMIAFTSVQGTVKGFMNFLSQREVMVADKKEIDEFWDKKTFDKKPPQIDIPANLAISSIRDAFVRFTGFLQVGTCQVIRIVGPTGAGKTTFIQMILGLREGILFPAGILPLSFIDKITYMRQNIREILPTKSVTVRQLFYESQDNEGIYHCMEIVGLVAWLAGIGGLDSKICEKISGGEKTRLCLAIILYKAIMNRSQWVILDEPEQGIDPEMAPRLITAVLDEFRRHGMTTFIITHLCNCQARSLAITHTWEISQDRMLTQSATA